MTHLTCPQRGVLLAGLIIAAVGIGKSPLLTDIGTENERIPLESALISVCGTDIAKGQKVEGQSRREEKMAITEKRGDIGPIVVPASLEELAYKAAQWDNWKEALEQSCVVCGNPFVSYERKYVEPVHNYCQTLIAAALHPTEEQAREEILTHRKAAQWDMLAGGDHKSKEDWEQAKAAFDKTLRDAALWNEHERDLGILAWQADSIDQAEEEHLAELTRDAALWKDNGWRAEVHLVGTYIFQTRYMAGDKKRTNPYAWGEIGPLSKEQNGDIVGGIEHLARAFVRTARELKLPLWVAVAIAQGESNFANHAVGKNLERTLMQINPLGGDKVRTKAIQEGMKDPATVIDWAMTNCFMPGYSRVFDCAMSSEQHIRAGLHHYNASQEYVDDVMARGAAMVKADALWALTPQ